MSDFIDKIEFVIFIFNRAKLDMKDFQIIYALKIIK